MMDDGDDEEVASNASSDLFEIESFSAHPTTRSVVSPMTPASASASTATSNHMYEPSEGSIDWSVTTAEGVADDDPIMQMRWPEKSRWRSGNGLLLSCRCEKAVSVGPNPKKCASAADQEHTPPSMKSMLRHVGSRPPMTHTQ